MRKVFDIKFKFGETVVLRTDPEKQPRKVSGLLIRPDKSIQYGLVKGEEETWHFDLDIAPAFKPFKVRGFV